MPRMVTKYGAGEQVQVLMGQDKETDWRDATIHRCQALRLYQVNVPGVGFVYKGEHEIRRRPDADNGD